jgi:hypothetical protein
LLLGLIKTCTLFLAYQATQRTLVKIEHISETLKSTKAMFKYNNGQYDETKFITVQDSKLCTTETWNPSLLDELFYRTHTSIKTESCIYPTVISPEFASDGSLPSEVCGTLSNHMESSREACFKSKEFPGFTGKFYDESVFS